MRICAKQVRNVLTGFLNGLKYCFGKVTLAPSSIPEAISGKVKLTHTGAFVGRLQRLSLITITG